MTTGRPITDRRHFWSDGHLYLLAFLAKKALLIEPCPNVLIEDLIDYGWEKCLRRREGDRLAGCSSYTLLCMLYRIRKEKYERKFTDIDEVDAPDRHNWELVKDDQIDGQEVMEVLEGKDLQIAELILQGYQGRQLAEAVGMTRGGVRQRLKKMKENYGIR